MAHGTGKVSHRAKITFSQWPAAELTVATVRRICCLAKTQIVNPHGLRRTHAILAIQAGIIGDAVARALGHESFAVTVGHYAKPEAVLGARTELVETALRKFRGSSRYVVGEVG
jgi:integrase